MSITRVFYYPGIDSKINNYPGTRVLEPGNTIFQKMVDCPYKQWIITEKLIILKKIELKNPNQDWETLFGVYF
jgi:hypothetical protein